MSHKATYQSQVEEQEYFNWKCLICCQVAQSPMHLEMVTRRNNPHPQKLDTMSSTLTTEITSNSDMEVVDVSLILGDTLVA